MVILYSVDLGVTRNLVDFENNMTIELLALFDLFSKDLKISWVEKISEVTVDLTAVVAKCDAKSCAAISFNVHFKSFGWGVVILYHVLCSVARVAGVLPPGNFPLHHFSNL